MARSRVRSYNDGMPEQVRHPRFHFDRDRSSVAPPSLVQMHDWAVKVLVSPHGAEVRDCIRAAGAIRARSVDNQIAVRDVAMLAATALKAAAAEVHDIAREFGFDPTTHPDTDDATGSLILVRIAADFPDHTGGALSTGLTAIAADLARTIHRTAEACALRELMRGMIARGNTDADVLRAIADDASPETVAALPAMWRALGGPQTQP